MPKLYQFDGKEWVELGKNGESIVGPKGDKGDKGDNGSPDTAKQVRDKLSSLKGQERLDAKHIKNLPEVVREVRSVFGGGGQVKDIVAGTGVSVEKSDSGKYTVSATGGTSSSDFADDVFSVHDNVDPTKILKFELSDLASPRTVTVRVPEMDTDGGEPDVLMLAQESFGAGAYRVGADWEFADINIGSPATGFLALIPTFSTPGTQTNLYNTQTTDRNQYLANATNATYLPWNSGATDGHLPLAGSLVYGGGANTALAELAIGAANAVLHVNSGATAPEWSSLTFVEATARLGVGVAVPTYAISISGEAAQTIAMERRTTSNVAGSALTIQAGSATLLATNKAGGVLNIAGGQSTGSASGGVINLQTSTGGSSGTGTNALSTKVSIGATPALAITITGKYNQTYTVATGSVTGFNQAVTGNNLGSGDQFIGQSWNYTPASLTDATAQGLAMQLITTISNTDSGGSSLQGFGFEIYEDGDHTANTGASGIAVGGFLRHSSSATGLSFIAFNADIQSGSSAATADFTIYNASASNFSGPVNTWKGFSSVDPGAAITTGSIVNAYAFYADAITGATNNYGIWLGGGLNVLGGNTRIGGTTDPTVALDVTGAALISSTLGVTGIITSSGGITMADAKNIVFNTTTGTKIGTATSQKIGFWNATPIVQPTTGIAAATFTANTSGIANDTATFDGYTIGQVVKALRNSGLLA